MKPVDPCELMLIETLETGEPFSPTSHLVADADSLLQFP